MCTAGASQIVALKAANSIPISRLATLCFAPMKLATVCHYVASEMSRGAEAQVSGMEHGLFTNYNKLT